MDIMTDPTFLAGVRSRSGTLRQKLEGLIATHPDVFESLRGSGMMLGLKCKVSNLDVVAAGYREQVITVPAGDNVIRLLPPLNISDEDIAEAIHRLDRAAASLEAQRA
jgi:acetylornithine/N-succinyldiaminopimelate aminotransferase